MKQILIYISLFLISICTINAQSVTANQMNGRLQMTSVSNVSDSTWSITGYFTNSVNKYLPSNINVNDKFFCQIGANTYVGRISVINSRSDVTKLITFRVICNYPNPPNNIGAIIRTTSNGYPVFVDGLPNALQAGIQNYFATLINTNAAGNPCEKTITKTSHGFRKGTPVKRVGGTYVRPTNDTIIPDFIVVDSLTANTFKVSTCGIYTSTLADGLYWYTSASPGYSLTQDTVKVPLFQVLNDTMILNPIVGFNLMSGSEGVTDGDKGDITVNSGTWTIDNGVITGGKIATNAIDSTKAANLSPTDLAQTGASTGQVLTWTGSKYAPRTLVSGITLDTVYAPFHGLTISTKGYIPVAKYAGNWREANSAADSMFHSAFCTQVIDDNHIVIRGPGLFKKTGHGLATNETYYLNDDGTERLSADSTYTLPTVRVVSDTVLNLLTGYYFNASGELPANIITGTGTVNQIPVFTGAETIAGSGSNGLRWNGSSMNIGPTVTPDWVGLNLWGGLSISNVTGGDAFLFYGNSGGTATSNLYTYGTTTQLSTRGIIRAGVASGSDLLASPDAQYPLQIIGTGAFLMPKGTEAQQPSTNIVPGLQRWSMTYDNLQIRGNSVWEYFVKADNAFGTNTVNTLAAWNGLGNRLSKVTKTNTPTGTTSVQTIDRLSGSINIEATGTSKVVNNNTVTANSLILCTIQGNDPTGRIKGVVPAAGSFTIYVDAPTGELKVAFFVIN